MNLEKNKKIVIETPRLILREFEIEDFDSLYEIVSDPETMAHYPKPFDKEKTLSWINKNLSNYAEYGFGLWAVVLKETGKFIGDCGIIIQNIDGEKHPEIGYHINKKYWRRGFAKEASRAVRDWAFTNTNFNALYSCMKYTNVSSWSTALSIGMKKVKEYADEKNKISYAFCIKKVDWKKNLPLEKYNLQKVKIEDLNLLVDFYNDVIDRTPNIQNTCKWKKNIYPAEPKIKEFILNDSLFALFENSDSNKKILASYAMIQEQEKDYDDVLWKVQANKNEILIVHALGVNPDFQNKGIAKYLIDNAIAFALKNNKKVVRLDSLESNKGAQKLYLSKGFEFCGIKELYTENTGLTNFYFYEYKV